MYRSLVADLDFWRSGTRLAFYRFKDDVEVATCFSVSRSRADARMVRYIKDGAYTIVVDDTASHEGNEAKEEAEERASPVTARSKESQSSRRPSESRRPTLTSSSSGRRPSVKPGSGRPGHEATAEKEKVKEVIEEEAVSEDEIDYTSLDFILQNLSFAKPKYESDNTHTLQSRRDIAEMISLQISYYVYCLLQSHVNRAESPTILQFGDGFIGCRIIRKLASNGCTNFLRIYCRGEVSASEWRTKGFVADCNIARLLAKEKPTIIIFTADYYSFHQIYHLLVENHLVQPETALITATLGFQRRKLYYNFSVPTILRAFVEPGEILSSYRSIAEPSASLVGPPTTLMMGAEERAEANAFPPPPQKEDGDDDDEKSDDDDDDDDDDEEPTENRQLSPGEKAAVSLAERTGDVRNLLFIIENFYALHGMSHDDSRRLALRTLTGYYDPSLKDTPIRKEKPVLQKKDRLVIRILEKAILQLYSSVAMEFQAELARRLTPEELQQLAREYVMETTMTDASLTKFQEEKSIRQRRMARIAIANASSNSPRAPDVGEGSRPSTGAGNQPEHPTLQRIPSRPNMQGEHSPRTGSPGHNRNAILVRQGSNHFFRNGKAYHPMHESSKINELFQLDDAYDCYSGPGFDYMRQLDSHERNKKVFKAFAVPPPLRTTFPEQSTSPGNGSPSSATPNSPAAMSPINFRRNAAEELSPLRIAQRNLVKF